MFSVLFLLLGTLLEIELGSSEKSCWKGTL